MPNPHRIGLYLAGKFPPYYAPYDRLKFLRIVAEKSEKYTAQELGFIKTQSDSPEEFYRMILGELFVALGEDGAKRLCEDLGVPPDVSEIKPIPVPAVALSSQKKLVDLVAVDKFLKEADEDEFARDLVIPLLHEMGLGGLSFFGKVNASDFGVDMYPARIELPMGISAHIGIQFKKTNLNVGFTGAEWLKLEGELRGAMKTKQAKHRSLDGSEMRLDGYVVISSGRKALGFDEQLRQVVPEAFVRAFGQEDVLSWCQQWPLPENVVKKIEG